MKWLKETLSDSEGLWDVAYVSLFILMLAVVLSLLTMTTMSVAAYWNCQEIPNKAGDALLKVCNYDPVQLGMAIGAACGGFSTGLGALAAYMLATRKDKSRDNNRPSNP